MDRVIVLMFFLVIVSCSSKTNSPQATFSFPATKGDAIAARKLLHDIAIENNLTFEDGSHKYPSGTTTLIAVAERVDGLQIILLGGAKTELITVAVHCHDKCTKWETIHKAMKLRFQKHWPISE